MKANELASMNTLTRSSMIPTLQMWQTKVSRSPLSRFVVSSTEGNYLPFAWTKGM